MDVDIQACIDGDPRAWDQFVTRWSKLIFSAVNRAVLRGPGAGSPRDLVEDIVQEVFVRLIKDDCRLLRTYDPARAGLSTWLTLVARSVAIDRLRRKARPVRSLEASEETLAVARTPEDQPTADTPSIPLHVLTSRQRLVLRLLFDEERSVEEVARFLAVDPQTVRSTKHKALSRLRAHLSLQPESPGMGRSG
ncbi:MAG: sigma-70 family RNA polymerase sigma factor [Phycisphaerales bacterium]|nr:sigma-70 family RNA polymerase sigma factor [Phycisphaerae bacterium]NNF42097.1 sigma-70 family RNA polymerase sigma factor [Phycisphaerales bacterium]NNM26759.1 sigma-70 family RNA polymerase sigma factor [Phycisphaerales bacterium]